MTSYRTANKKGYPINSDTHYSTDTNYINEICKNIPEIHYLRTINPQKQSIMKKLLLFLLPALLLPTIMLTSCKEEENKDFTTAKALVGTYDYRRVGDLNYRGQKETMNVSGIATITYDGANRILIEVNDVNGDYIIKGQIDSGVLSIDSYGRVYYNNSSNDFSAYFEVRSAEAVYDIYQNILIRESYQGNVKFPYSGISCTGSGLLSFTRQQ